MTEVSVFFVAKDRLVAETAILALGEELDREATRNTGATTKAIVDNADSSTQVAFVSSVRSA